MGLVERDWLRQRQAAFAGLVSSSLEKPLEWFEFDSFSYSDSGDTQRIRDVDAEEPKARSKREDEGEALSAEGVCV